MQLKLVFDRVKHKKPDIRFKKEAYKSLDINERINLKSWFFEPDYKDAFWSFINQSLVLVNIYNNGYYIENLKTKP